MSKKREKKNNLLELIAADPAFNLTLEELERSMDPAKYVGRAPLQVTKFLENVVHPALAEKRTARRGSGDYGLICLVRL